MPNNTADNRELDRYYTPDSIAHALVSWAVKDRHCTILDPSYGGCSFFRAAVAVLRDRGASKPGRLLYGVDVDPYARQFLPALFADGAVADHFLTKDFLSVGVQGIKDAPFQAVVGNPPYVRHHRLLAKFDMRNTLGVDGVGGLSARASYWAYFVLHSLEFVAPKGSLALVLPGAFLFSDYALTVRRRVIESFSEVTVVLVTERLFSEAEQTSVLLLASGRGLPSCELRIGVAWSSREVGTLCKDVPRLTERIPRSISAKQWLRRLLPKAACALYDELRVDRRVRKLGHYATVGIGTVTGCNRLFIIPEPALRSLKVRSNLVQPVLSRALHLRGLVFKRADYNTLVSLGHPTNLLQLARGCLSPELRNYLRRARRQQIHKRYKCRIRSPWYSVGNVQVPPAFLHYMSAFLPHIVLNSSGATCSNAIHQVFWRRRLRLAERRSLALSSVTSLFQMSAELCGRSYGGGVLKLEPSEAEKLSVIALSSFRSGTVAKFGTIDSYLRAANREAATDLADRVVLRSCLGLSKADCAELAGAINLLRRMRLPRIT